jgi:hypothetical protein
MEIIQEKIGLSMFTKYGMSIYRALKAAYPEYNWLPWKFDVLPTGSFRKDF